MYANTTTENADDERGSQRPPQRLLFVGDSVRVDIDPPRALGMRALLVTPVWDQERRTAEQPPFFAQLPEVVKAAGR